MLDLPPCLDDLLPPCRGRPAGDLHEDVIEHAPAILNNIDIIGLGREISMNVQPHLIHGLLGHLAGVLLGVVTNNDVVAVWVPCLDFCFELLHHADVVHAREGLLALSSLRPLGRRWGHRIQGRLVLMRDSAIKPEDDGGATLREDRWFVDILPAEAHEATLARVQVQIFCINEHPRPDIGVKIVLAEAQTQNPVLGAQVCASVLGCPVLRESSRPQNSVKRCRGDLDFTYSVKVLLCLADGVPGSGHPPCTSFMVAG